MPHIDKGALVERALAAELSMAARDRIENEARIREQVEVAPRRGCDSCGDPYAAVNPDGRCDLCEREAWIPAARRKLGVDEIFDQSNETEEQ